MSYASYLLCRLVALLLQALSATWQYRVAGWPDFARVIASNKPGVGTVFHGRLLCLLGFFARPERGPWTVMVSRSRDGDLMSTVIEALGWSTVRGSSGRGGALALVDGAKVMRAGIHPRMCMAVDGSRGPRYVAKVGSLSLASRAGGWLVSVQAAPSRALVLRKTWDHTTIPVPWSRISVICSKPIYIPPHLDNKALERLQPYFQAMMEAQRRWVDARARRGRWR